MKPPGAPGSTLPLPLPGSQTGPGATVLPLPGRTRQPPANNGKKPPRSLWYALHLPQLAALPEKQRQQQLEQLASLANDVSASVSFHPCALVFEIRSSLRYFGGIDKLHESLAPRVTQLLQERGLPTGFQHAASPTATGSLLLARGGQNLLVYRRDNLRSALGRLSTDVLELDREQRRRLYNMGVRRLQDLWRLPGNGLRKRFGSNFVNQLQKALGEQPEPQRYYQPAPAFSSSYELSCEIEELGLLLPVLEEFLAQLVDFLRRRDLSTSRLVVSLVHERQDDTDITLGLRQPSRCQRHLQQLLEIHLNKLAIPAPVVAVRMQVIRFDAYLGESGRLLQGSQAGTGPRHGKAGNQPTRRRHDEQLGLFLEQLQARLGERPVHAIGNVAEHCPEYASRQLAPLQTAAPDNTPQTTRNPRPFWLLATPQALAVRNGKLYHRRPIRILSGPERIETRWWSGCDVRRDYYVALEENGSRLWIYREKTGERGWYLHGIFA